MSEAPRVYKVRGYFVGQNPQTRLLTVESLSEAREIAKQLKIEGFFVEIRDTQGKIVSLNA
jgi:hypothetical protein